MGLFDSIKNAFSSEMPGYWGILAAPSELEHVIQASNDWPQLIYKHSHRCATCFFSKKQVEEGADTIIEKADLYFLDVIGSRPVSNAVAEKLNVRHESPQIILLNKEEVTWHESHGAIKTEVILTALHGNG
ncbi:bacillithiol system redox-active protein YtxJ [Fodinibius salsisoli]|uniref:Bacillithiol system redox-active protein YtxJ n=1 Tax=Fodinibius salsisoli TaxID=2820877 RepID=A0ABT3PT24_9BACT|nr:bacillithiol system redox-active protein YtxJ [Fodinibius salsisoli]MCW9709002.1 bacillithiol system redox-active protein YtxJ [Fodinibius salsisoli]